MSSLTTAFGDDGLFRSRQSDALDLKLLTPIEALLYQIINSFRDGAEQAILLTDLTQLLVSLFGLDHAMVELYDVDRATGQVCYAHSTSDQSLIGHQRLIDDFELIYEPLLHCGSIQFSELCPHWHPLLAKIPWLGCPIFTQDCCLGVLWTAKSELEFFSQTEQIQLQQVANVVAIALRQEQCNQTLQSQAIDLAKLNQLKDDVFQLISHDLLTPLSSIQLASQTLDKLFAENNWLKAKPRKTVSKILAILQQECKRQNTLVDNLLTLIIPDLKRPLDPVLLDLKSWLPSLVRPFQGRLDDENLTLALTITETLPQIECDIPHLERIVGELVSNALAYTPPGGVISMEALQLGEQLCLKIENTGVEIPAEHIPYLFDKFYRVPSLDAKNYGGTGLGLALVKRMVGDLGGQIQVTSQNQMTSFELRLPLVVSNA